MRILYPFTMCLLPGQKYTGEVVALAIMGQAGAALTGNSQFIDTTTDMYMKYCLLSGNDFWTRLMEIIADGGEVWEVEAFLQAPETLLDEEVPEGIRYRDIFEQPGVFRTFQDWNDGGNQPIFNLVNDDVILRTNIGGTSITYQEIAILGAIPGVTLLNDIQVQEVINANTPVI